MKDWVIDGRKKEEGRKDVEKGKRNIGMKEILKVIGINRRKYKMWMRSKKKIKVEGNEIESLKDKRIKGRIE